MLLLGWIFEEFPPLKMVMMSRFNASISENSMMNLTSSVGVSLGGLVGVLLAERYPGQYDGALLVSGVVGGVVGLAGELGGDPASAADTLKVTLLLDESVRVKRTLLSVFSTLCPY